jgi:c-di-AMP phosphodiesterase-like protein
MNQKFDKVSKYIFIIALIILSLLIVLYFVFEINILLSMLVFVVMTTLVFYVTFYTSKINEENMKQVEDIVENSLKSSYAFAEVGSLIYDDNYNIIWMNSFLQSRQLNKGNLKLLTWLPELDELISNETDKVKINLDEKIYLVSRTDTEPLLVFKDITEKERLAKLYRKEKIVVGVIHFDNYEESTFYQDEQNISFINTTVRQPVLDWCVSHGMIVKSLRSYRLFVVLNETIYDEILATRFDILNTVRKASKDAEVAITLSMGFANGSSNFGDLDNMANELLNLAQSRGGDQVATRTKGKDVKYYGGSTLAIEKRSKVRVRIMTHTLKDLIQKSSNVIICGHKESDADCVGSMLCISRIAQSFNKETSMIIKSGGLENIISETINLYKNELEQRHNFITENEAMNQLTDDTLVIMMDHHYYMQSNGENILQKAKKIAIIDHHRRIADLGINPLFVYVETAASSTCELVMEFIPYLTNKVNFTSSEANVMYLGINIDTGNFKVRTGARTFNVLATLRQLGADPGECTELLKEPFKTFKMRNKLVNSAEGYNDTILISAVDDNVIYNRSIISQAANELLEVKKIQAVFVVAKISSNTVAVSARSNGEFNVQLIMEQMNGGGHLNAAAVQRKNQGINEIRDELVEALNKSYLEGINDEINIT